MSKNRAVPPPVVRQQYDPEEVWDFQNQWTTTLCGCKPATRCLFSCFCCCCMGCDIAKAEGEPIVCGCLPCCFPYLRTKLRTARRIKGNCCSDTCFAICCMPCSATQLSNELESQGLWAVPKAKTNNKPAARQNRPYD